MPLTLRSTKGSRLTHAEFDANFQALDRGFTPEQIDEADAEYFYFGATINGAWQVRRQSRATAKIEIATSANNSHSDLAAAWGDRASLNYGA